MEFFNSAVGVSGTYESIGSRPTTIGAFVFLILSTNLLIILSSSLCVFYYTDRYCDY